MNLQIDFWQLVGLLLTGLGALIGVMRFGVAQAQKHQDATHAQLLARLDAMEQADNDSAAQWVRIEREVLQLKADMPLQYVRREDYIRGQSVIESKLDSIASELKVTQIKIGGSPHADRHR